MSSTGVRESNDNNKRIIKGLIQNEAQFIQSLRVFANTSTLSGLGSTEGDSNNSPNEPSGNYFAKSGDILLGQFGNAFDTIAATNIIGGILDVSKTSGVTFPVVILQGESPPAADDLVTITEGVDVFPFQELVIRTRSSVITVKNSDNINTPDGNDLVLPVGSIIHLYLDSFLGEWVIDGGTPFFGGGAGGEFFGPWTANHDAGNFALNNVSSIQISDSVGGVHSLLQGLAGIGTRLTLTAGEKFQIFDNITNIFEITNAFGMDLKQHDLFGVTGLDFDGVAPTIEGLANLDFLQASHSINSLSGSMLFQVNSTDFLGFFAGGVEIARFQDIATVLSLDMKDHAIANTKHIVFDSGATYTLPNTAVSIGYDDTANELRYNVENLGTHNWLLNGVEKVEIAVNNMTFGDGYQVIFNPDTTNPGVNIGLVVGDPSATNDGDLWYNATTNKFRTKENGVNVDVVGVSNQISQLDTSLTITDTGSDGNISYVRDGQEKFNLGTSNFLALVNSTAFSMTSAANTMQMLYSGTEFQQNVTAGNSYALQIGGVDKILVANTLITINQDLTLNGDLDMTGGDIDNVDDINFSLGGQIQQSASGINFDTPSGDFWRARAGTLSRFEITNANDVLITSGLGTLTFATGNGTFDNIILRDIGNFDFRVATNQDMIFFEAATEIGRYDGGLNKWEFNPSSEFAVEIGSSEKFVIDSGTIEVTPNVTLFSVRSSTTNIDSTTINMGNAITDRINWLGRWQFAFLPAATNTSDIGSSSLRVREIFSNNVLNVSFSEFKKDITSLDDKDCMGICGSLNTIEYKWNDKAFTSDGSLEDEISKNRKYVGFNADALRTMLPNAVKDDMIYPNAVTGLLLGSVRYLDSRESELENRITELENQITDLKKTNN